MLPEISHSIQPNFSKFESNSQAPEFRSNDRGLASIQASKAYRQTLTLIWALLYQNNQLAREIGQLKYAFASEEIRPIEVAALRDEVQRLETALRLLEEREY